MCEELLGDYDGSTSIARNSTERSELAENIVLAFLRNRAISAIVRWEHSGYGQEELYKGLWNTCQKEPYKRLVAVSTRKDQLILKRIG
jgi:hypothetical protein